MIQNAQGLLAVDVDGTLITDHGHITDRVRDALGRASATGWEIVIASGRTFPAAMMVVDEFPFVRYAVVSNGACIIDVQARQTIHCTALGVKNVRRAVEVMREAGAPPALYTTSFAYQKVLYDRFDETCEFFRWYVTNDPRCIRVGNVLAHADDVLQIGSVAKRETIFRIRDRLTADDVVVMTMPFESPRLGGKNHNFWFAQIVARGATKFAALVSLAGLIGVPAGRIVAVGDNYNDIEMISRADVGVAMGNAPDEVKAVARVVVGTNNDSGLSEVVDQILLSAEYFPQPD